MAEALQQAAPGPAAEAKARAAEAAAAAAAVAAKEATPEPAGQRRGGLAKRKRPRLDVGPDGRPATQLPSRAVHALLQDRSSLLTTRGQAPLLQKPHDQVRAGLANGGAGTSSFQLSDIVASMAANFASRSFSSTLEALVTHTLDSLQCMV